MGINNNFNKIKNCIDEKGNLNKSPEEIQSSIKAAELLCESLLGATLNIRSNIFVIRMLEIYYGSVADDSHDWYRNRFKYKTSKYVERSEVQSQKGFKIYTCSPDMEDSHNRMDIVVGNENVAISFLLRSIWDKNFKRIGTNDGSPNIVLNTMGIKPTDHRLEIQFGTGNGSICIEDTHDRIYKEKNLITKRSERLGVSSDFEKRNNLQWNFCAE